MESIHKFIQRVKWLLPIMAIMTALSGQADASSTIPIGVYNGPGAVTAHNNFEAWLGSPVLYTTDYVAYTNGWSTDFNPTWLIGPWSQWVRGLPDRRLVLGLPMLENGYAGQFAQGANGQFDGYFLGLAKQLVSNGLGNSIIRLGYEANCNTIGPWQATDDPSGYVTDFRHIVGLLRSVPGQSFLIDWTVCNGLQSGHVLNSFASFYPGDDVVDIMGIDQYDVEWGTPNVTPQDRWQYNLTRYMGLQDQANFAVSHNKPVSFPEWGLYAAGDQFAGGGDDPYFIDQMADWMAAHSTYYQSYFNLNWGGGVLSDFPNGQAEYKLRFGPSTSSTDTTSSTTSSSGGTTSTSTSSSTPPPADTTAPVVSIASPLNGANVNVKYSVAINASATDNVAVSKILLYIDGSNKKTVYSGSLNYSWTPKSVGYHTLAAQAFDAAGNTSKVSVTVYAL